MDEHKLAGFVMTHTYLQLPFVLHNYIKYDIARVIKVFE